jgi:uncharacterized protein YkwD
MMLWAVALGCADEVIDQFDGQDDPTAMSDGPTGPGDDDPSSSGGDDDDDDDADTWPAELIALEDEVLRLVNQLRAVGGTCGGVAMSSVPPLEMDDVLRDVARAFSRDMAVRGFFDHVDPDGDGPQERMAAAGFDGASPWGENIAFGPTTAAQVVEMWTGSTGHCQNMLEPGYAVIGIGAYADGTPAGTYWTQDFAGSH